MSIAPRSKDPERTYEHRFHAGNPGDVWKHVALLALLSRAGDEVSYVETHAGAGRYRLGATGEWQEGYGRVRGVAAGQAPAAVRRYLDAVGEWGTARSIDYPGSPLLAARALGARARLVLHELFEGPRSGLHAALGADPRVRIRGDDGLAALARGLSDDVSAADAAVVLVDPPFHDKREWTDLPRALAAAARALPRAQLLAWYPIKSHTRPNAMLAALRDLGTAGVACELVTAPLAVRKNRLAGSGMICVRPPAGLLEELASAAAFLGPALALHAGHWTARVTSWGELSAP